MIVSSGSTNSKRHGQLVSSASSSSRIPTLCSKRHLNSEGLSSPNRSSSTRNGEHQRNIVETRGIEVKYEWKTEIDPLRRGRGSSKLASHGSPRTPHRHRRETSEKENANNIMEKLALTRTTSVQLATANVSVQSVSDRVTSTNGPPTPRPLPKTNSTLDLAQAKTNCQSALTLGPSSTNLTPLGAVLRNTQSTTPTPAKGSSRPSFSDVSNPPSRPGFTQSSTILPMICDLSRTVLADSLRLQTCSTAAGHPVQTVSALSAREISSTEVRDSDLGSVSVSLSPCHLALPNGNNEDVPAAVCAPGDEEESLELMYPLEDSDREGDEGATQYPLSTPLVTETNTKSGTDETESILPSGVEVKKASGPLITVFQGTAYEAKVDIAKVGLPQCVSTKAITTDGPAAVNEAATTAPECPRPSVPMPPTRPSTALAGPASASKRSGTKITSTSSLILCRRLQNEFASGSAFATGHHDFVPQAGGRLEVDLKISQDADAGPIKTRGFGGMIIDRQAEGTKKELAKLRARMGGSVLAKAKEFGRTIWSPASEAKDRYSASSNKEKPDKFEMLPPAPFRAKSRTNEAESKSVNAEMPSWDWEDMSVPRSRVLSARGGRKIIGCATAMDAVVMTRQLWKTRNFMFELE